MTPSLFVNLLFILYSINMYFYLFYKNKADANAETSLFKKLHKLNITPYQFITTYSNIMMKSTPFFILIGLLGILREFI